MAKINFRIRSKENKSVPIYIYLSNGRGNMVESRTGFNIHFNDWSNATKLPKQNNAENKSITISLKKLNEFIHSSINDANSKGIEIDKFWLDSKIKECFGRVELKDADLLINHMQSICDNHQTRKVRVKGGFKLGISANRLRVYKLFINVLKNYESDKKTKIRFSKIDRKFEESFIQWLIVERRYSKNFAGKQVSDLRMVCNDAIKNDIKVNPYALQIESFNESNSDRYIVTLGFDEIKKIKDCVMPSGYLENAKKWLILGCEIGQRGGDLLNITKENIRYKNGLYYIDLLQEKTGKPITVSINDKYILNSIFNAMPNKITSTKLNEYIKKVCKLAGIDEPIEGKKMNPVTNRKEYGIFPKHELITTHSFRRSFSTNYYKKVPTSILIAITGHSTEELFLHYINKPKDTDSNADMFSKYHEEIHMDRKIKELIKL